MKKPVQIFPTRMRVYSHVGYSREQGAYYIGRPDGPTSALFAISAREAEEIMANLPEELLEVVKEHHGLVELSSPFSDDGGISNETPYEGPLEPTEDEVDVDIDNMTIAQLREIASQLEIKSYTKYNKEELIAKIEEVAETSEA